MEEKQQFTTFDTVSVFVLMGLTAVLVLSSIPGATGGQKIAKARTEAGQLAVQILSGGYQSLLIDTPKSGPASRGLASSPNIMLTGDGRIAKDPWGQPYFYRVTRDVTNRWVAVVYSGGPNKERDTAEKAFRADGSGRFKEVAFSGDDVGFVQRHW